MAEDLHMVGLTEEWLVPRPVVALRHQHDELDGKLLANGANNGFK